MTATQDDTIAELQRTIAELRRERDAALAQRNSEYDERIEQQSATIDVLKVMSASPGNPQPVFDLIVRRAHELCNAMTAALYEYDGELIHYRSDHGTESAVGAEGTAAYRSQFPMAPTRASIACRAILDRHSIHIRDMRTEPGLLAVVPDLGHRSNLAIPFLREGTTLGAISLSLAEPGGFTDSQVELLKTFAEQAVIAIGSAETYRALQTRTADLQESLEYQTATSDVLKVISGSDFDLEPVFQAVVDTAARLCRADQATIYRCQDDEYRWAAGTAMAPDYERIERSFRARPGTGTLVGRVALARRTEQIVDAWTDPLYEVKDDARVGDIRTMLGVPLMRDGAPIGVIALARQRVEPFTERQIELVSTFADQAVIAIENTRLLTEQQEALERQTATSEVLQVINASPGDLAPVFDAVLERALRLCGASFGTLATYDGERIERVAFLGVPPAFIEYSQRNPLTKNAALIARGIATGKPVQAPDVMTDPLLANSPDVRDALVELGGVRALLQVPLLKDGAVVGFIGIWRREPGAFPDKQIVLLEGFAAQAVIAMENARLLTEQREALEQQTATAEILRVINESPGNPLPVYDKILEKAHTVCGADVGTLATWDGTHFRAVATLNYPEEVDAVLRRPFLPAPSHQRLLDGAPFTHIPDAWASREDSDIARAIRGHTDLRTMLAVALRKDGKPLGFVSAHRHGHRPYTVKEIALLESFADQAVIAMENARLLTEQREALEQQTATAEVLQVINTSPGDLAPVFDAMLEKAMRLCGAAFGMLYTYDGECFHIVATRGIPAALAEFRAKHPPSGRPGGSAAPLIEAKRPVHVLDMTQEPSYLAGPAINRATADLGGARTILNVPLLKDGALVGAITIYRQEVRAFSDKDIALLENFAAQAVIAMENARLLTETREALEQQTATAEVLQIINESPGDLAPVFDAILNKAHTLCGAAIGSLYTWDGESVRAVATHGFPEDYAAFARQKHPPNFMIHPLIDGGRYHHVPDVRALGPTQDKHASTFMEQTDARTILLIPLRKDGAFAGFISAVRTEVRSFVEKEIALLENFAAQAMIAMENARLIDEQREALEQQTATAEVLQVINESPANLAPVFDAVLEKAIRLCDSAFGMLATYDGHNMRYVAMRGLTPEQEALLADRPLAPGQPTGRIGDGESVVHLMDARDQDGYRAGFSPTRNFVDQVGARTAMWVALRKDNELLGILTIFRREVRAFADQEIALVQNFAAQAVIAMENARLINEQREALEQQTATAEVLQVINASPGNLAPVFDAILEKAHTICNFGMGSLVTYDGSNFHNVARRGYGEQAVAAISRARSSPWTAQRALLRGDRLVHIPDLSAYPWDPDDTVMRPIIENLDLRAGLLVPLRKDSYLLGYISGFRREAGPFSEKDIALLENFAAQAVIAMENARLLTEQQEALEQQTATAEVLQVINASPGNLAPVFDAMLEKGMRLCGAAFGMLRGFDGKLSRNLATRGVPAPLAAYMAENVFTPMDELAQALEDGRPRQVLDMKDTEGYKGGAAAMRAIADLGGARSIAVVPLVKDQTSVGHFTFYRLDVRAFTDKQIALLENFAAQAVIAMESARLLTEQQEALEQQTATAEVLQVINASPGNLAPVYDAMLEKAMHLCGAVFGSLTAWDGKYANVLAMRGFPPALAQYMAARGPKVAVPPVIAQLSETKRPQHVADVMAGEGYRNGHPVSRAVADLGGARTILHVPLLKDEAMVGYISVYRQEVRAFTDKQIALLENFAAQGVIAMENARLITEQRDALEQQTATAEVLQVINASPGNLAPVYDAMLEKAMHLCGAVFGSLAAWDGKYANVLAMRGFPPALAQYMAAWGPKMPVSPVVAQLSETKRPQHIADQMAGEGYRSGHPVSRAVADLGGARTILHVPLRKDDAMVGYISVYRREVRAFTDKQIALLENFAAQAVIAMENARLLDEIRQRQEELRVTFENMGDGVAMFDETQHLVAWNHKFQDILDVPDAILARRPTFPEYVRYLAERGEYGAGPDPEEQVRRLTEQASQYRAYERTRPDGRVIEIRHNPVPGGGFVLIYADITERKRNEAEIRAARDAAEEASRTIEAAFRELKAAQANLVQAEKMASLGQLTAGIAHEIKNPLNFVNNFAALSVDLLSELKETAAPGFAALTDDQRAEIEDVSAMLTSNLEKITEHGKRADSIVKAMLEHSRGSSVERRTVDLNAVIDEALNLAYHGARAHDQSFNITLERDFGAGIAPIEVNPQDMTRVFLNIFSNGFYAATRRARNGADAGFVPTLKVTTHDAGEAVEIRVRDNGTGIPAEIRDKLFQPFFTTKPTGEGTGLGLSITYDIVTQQHGGSIAVDSNVGEYTEFTIRLPRNP